MRCHSRNISRYVLALAGCTALLAVCVAADQAVAARPTPPEAAPSAVSARAAPKPRKRRVKRRRVTRASALLALNSTRAQRAFAAMQKYYLLSGSSLYSGEPFASLWAFSQAFAATVTLASARGAVTQLRAELSQRLAGLSYYFDSNNSNEPEGTFTSSLPGYDGIVASPAGPGGAKFFDDNAWVGIELARLYKLTHNAEALALAQGIMAFEMAGWQGNVNQACPGGIPFENEVAATGRNTVANAPTAELAVQLYRITGDRAQLDFATMAYEWVRRCLLLPSGLYADSIRPRGQIDPTVWSYNQGSMIGAGTLLYQATGNSAFLYEARQTARAATAYFTLARLQSEIPFFPAVYFRNLMYLDSVTHDPPGLTLAQAYGDNAWATWLQGNGVFVWGSPPSSELLVQSALTQIYGLLASPASTYF